jgi:hypothetical protein
MPDLYLNPTSFHAKKSQIGKSLLNKSNVTPWSRNLLENLRVTKLVKTFPAAYETKRCITVFLGALYSSMP